MNRGWARTLALQRNWSRGRRQGEVPYRLVGIAAINEAASEIRKRIPEYRYKVVGDIHTMHNVGMCRWGSGLPDQPFRYTGTDVLEERDGRVAVFYTFIDSGTPPVSSTE